MKTLVTGAGGFLGLYIVERLVARGDSVRTFSRGHYPALEQLGVEQIRGDLRDAAAVQDACRDCEVVHHAGAVAGIWGPWQYYHSINTLGTENVIAGCLQHGVRRLVYTSSPSVTFAADDQEGIDEQAAYAERWYCHYPHSKALAEQRVLQVHGRQGLLTCALRPHLIWGPRDQHLIPRLLRRAQLGRLKRVGDGRNLIDIVYVENAAQAQIMAADALQPGSPVGGQAYFISQGEPVNCWQWIDQVLQLFDLPPVRKSVSFSTAWKAGYVLESIHHVLRIKREPIMTRFLAAQLAKSHYFDIRRARRDFGYEPAISTEQGLQRLAQSDLPTSPQDETAAG